MENPPIWERVDKPDPSKAPERYARFFRQMIGAGLLDKKPDAPFNFGPAYHDERFSPIKSFCAEFTDDIGNIAKDISLADPQHFIIELTRRLQLLQLNEESLFAARLTDIRHSVGNGASFAPMSAISAIAFSYYIEHADERMAEDENGTEEKSEEAA